jgi:hypothetical protein
MSESLRIAWEQYRHLYEEITVPGDAVAGSGGCLAPGNCQWQQDCVTALMETGNHLAMTACH